MSFRQKISSPRIKSSIKQLHRANGVLGAVPLTSEFGYPNSVLAATRDSRLVLPSKAPTGKKGGPQKHKKDADPLGRLPQNFFVIAPTSGNPGGSLL